LPGLAVALLARSARSAQSRVALNIALKIIILNKLLLEKPQLFLKADRLALINAHASKKDSPTKNNQHKISRTRRPPSGGGHRISGHRSTPPLTRLGLNELGLARRPAPELSVGQQQRIAAARALIGGPNLIVANEPSSALDTDRRRDLVALLRQDLRGAHGRAPLTDDLDRFQISPAMKELV
jgi:ABC-type dipeptide/oligopeptide/nickel transport system ATPase subunit